jgi:ATP-dependent RNA helicase RhlE
LGQIDRVSRSSRNAPGPPKAETVIDSNRSRSTGPKTSFRSFKLHDDLQRGVHEMGFSEPRPIQAQTIPAALEGRDILGLAATGTGKTAAFALPILQRLITRPRRDAAGPRALIVAPTRELAAQIQAEIDRLAKHTRARTVTVFGGVGVTPQVKGLKARPEIVVACPGRLLDLHEQRAITLRDVEVLVLDEADHMFDMGFLPSLKRILRLVPEERQNLLFSATMPKEIRQLADRVLHRPHVAELDHSAPAKTIEHGLFAVEQTQKTELLEILLEEEGFSSAIVFLRTKHRAKRLAQQLSRKGHRATSLQGNLSQSQRDTAMKGFRSGRFDVLVATDIAARGIDVADVSHVINYDVPNTPDAYTHRIGRTGRSAKSGKAYTFVTRDDREALHAIEKRLGKSIQRYDLPGLSGEHARGEFSRRSAGAGRSNGAARTNGSAPRRGTRPGRGGASPSRGAGHTRRTTRPVAPAAPTPPPAPPVPQAPATPFGANLDLPPNERLPARAQRGRRGPRRAS